MASSRTVSALGVVLLLSASACGSDAVVDTMTSEPTDVNVATSVEEPIPETVEPSTSEPTITVGLPETIDDTAAEETTTSSPPEPIGLVTAIVDIQYYGACGTETFELDGETWYPLPFREQERIDRADYAAAESITEPAGLVRVAPPGPGDDVGTLFVYEDGLGRFISDSGLIDFWMTTDEQTFDWDC